MKTVDGLMENRDFSLIVGFTLLRESSNVIRETEKLRDQELKAYQSTVENLKLKLDSATAILPELQKVVEDAVETDKPKRKRNTKK